MAADVLEMSLDLEQRTLTQPWYESMVVIEWFQVEMADAIQSTVYPWDHGCAQCHLSHAIAEWQNTLCTFHIFYLRLEKVSTSANVGLLTVAQDG